MTQLPFINEADGTVDVRIKPYIPKYDPSWRTFEKDSDPYPEFKVVQPALTPAHTLDFARYWFNLGDSETHYVIEKAPIEAYINGHPEVSALVTGWIGKSKMAKVRAFKELLASGNPIVKGFWCAGLTLITLGAAGYDLQTPLTGKNGRPHGYVDSNGWEAIRPWMLIDGQPEATAAMGVILREYPNGDVNGLTVYLTGDLATIRDHSNVDIPPKEKTPKILEGDVVKENVKFVKDVGGTPSGLDDESMYQEDTYCKATKTETDYQDFAAVRFGPGAVELMGIGQRVSVAKIRPGDIGQFVYPTKIDGVLHYIGKGHAFQIWEVRVRGPLDDPDAPNAPVPVGDGLPDADGNVLFAINQYTKATKLLDEAVKIVAYRVIEANLPGSSQGLATTLGGRRRSIDQRLEVLSATAVRRGRGNTLLLRPPSREPLVRRQLGRQVGRSTEGRRRGATFGPPAMSAAIAPIAEALFESLHPLVLAAENKDYRKHLLRQLGWDEDAAAELFVLGPQFVDWWKRGIEHQTALAKAIEAKDGEAQFLHAMLLLEIAFELSDAIAARKGKPSDGPLEPGVREALWNDLAVALPEYLLLRWVRLYKPVLYWLLRITDVVEIEAVDGSAPARIAADVPRLRTNRIGPLFSETETYLKGRYDWGFDAAALKYPLRHDPRAGAPMRHGRLLRCCTGSSPTSACTPASPPCASGMWAKAARTSRAA